MSVITCDGKVLLGKLEGFDQRLNLILNDCKERTFSMESGVVEDELGMQMVRGDNV